MMATVLVAILASGLTLRVCREVPEMAYVVLMVAGLTGFAVGVLAQR